MPYEVSIDDTVPDHHFTYKYGTYYKIGAAETWVGTHATDPEDRTFNMNIDTFNTLNQEIIRFLACK